MLDTVYTLSLAFTTQLVGARISFPDFARGKNAQQVSDLPKIAHLVGELRFKPGLSALQAMFFFCYVASQQ